MALGTFCVMIFIRRTMAAVFQSPSPPKPYPFSISLWMARPRQLLQSAQIPEVGNDSLIVLFLQETLKADLDLRLYGYVTAEFRLVSSLQEDVVFVVILFYQSVGIRLGNGLNRLRDLIYGIRVDLPAKLNLRFYFIALCNCHVSHIVGNPHHADMAALHDAYGGSHPGGNLLLHLGIAPVAHYNLSLDSHAGYDMPVFPVAVGGLVLVHEVHVNGIVGNLLVELGMQMHQRFSVLLQSQNPGFCR